MVAGLQARCSPDTGTRGTEALRRDTSIMRWLQGYLKEEAYSSGRESGDKLVTDVGHIQMENTAINSRRNTIRCHSSAGLVR